MKKFLVTEKDGILSIEQRLASRFISLIRPIIIFLFSLLVLVFPYDQLMKLHEYAYLVYFVPIFPFFRIIQKIFKSLSGHHFIINSKTNQIHYNDRYLDRLTNVEQVEWNIDSIAEHNESYLELKSKENRRHRISTTSNVMNKEHLELGRTLAKFLKIQFVNNHPYERDILWGKYDVDEKSINSIENKYE